ncbi:MAG: VOC family protein [Chloroflexota bacterium]|nr:VOC family protein [Chloroflexota bacterium]
MTDPIRTGAVHHLRLTVTDVTRAREFYTSVLGFQEIAPLPSGVLLGNGTVLLGLGPAPEQPITNDRFDENRVGLDHLSFTVNSRDELDAAERLLNQRGIPNGGVKDLGQAFGLYILAFRDPDNIQLELTALYG